MPKPSTLVITGGAACGKSYALEFLVQRLEGEAVRFNSDECVRLLYERPENQQRLSERFGDSIFSPQGVLRNDELRKQVLTDPAHRLWLEEFIYPQVGQARADFVASVGQQNSEIRWIFAEIPLWFEKQVAWEANLICLIGANRQLQLRRITQERGLSLDQANRLLDLQLASEKKSSLADVVCWNDGTVCGFREQLKRFSSHYLV